MFKSDCAVCFFVADKIVLFVGDFLELFNGDFSGMAVSEHSNAPEALSM
jgi:hypothetical protein